MNNRRFVNNIISDFPIFILQSKDSKLIQDYIIEVAVHIADLKDAQILEKITSFFADKIIHGQQNLSIGCYRFDKRELIRDLIKYIEDKP